MKGFITNIVLVLFALCVYSQDKNKILTVKDMHRDIDYYYSTLKDVHPNPFIVLTEKEFDYKIDSLKKEITTPLTKKDFYLHITSLNKYTDLHTYIAASRKMREQQNSTYVLPKYFISKDSVFFMDTTKVRQRVLRINNIDIKDILDYFLSRRNLVEVSNEYTFYDVISLYIVDHFLDTNLVLNTISNNNKQHTFVYKPKQKSKISKDSKKGQKGYRIYRLELDTINKIALFELNTFMPAKLRDQIGFVSMIDRVFDTLKLQNIKRLYIDLTCNRGGLIAFEEEVLKHFLSGQQKKLSWDLVVKQSNQRKKQRGPFSIAENGNYYQTRRYINVQEKENRYKGEVYVIQSRNSFSAASTLASHLQTYIGATIIGEECQIKAVYTDPISLKLPESKFRFSCATGFIRNIGKNKLRGVVPDITYKFDDVYQTITIKDAEKMRTSQENVPNNIE